VRKYCCPRITIKIEAPLPLNFPKRCPDWLLPKTGYPDLGKSNMTITRNLGGCRKYRSNRSNSLYFSSHVSLFLHFNKLLWYETNSYSIFPLKEHVGPIWKQSKIVKSTRRIVISQGNTLHQPLDLNLTWIRHHLKQNPKPKIPTNKSELAAPNKKEKAWFFMLISAPFLDRWFSQSNGWYQLIRAWGNSSHGHGTYKREEGNTETSTISCRYRKGERWIISSRRLQLVCDVYWVPVGEAGPESLAR